LHFTLPGPVSVAVFALWLALAVLALVRLAIGLFRLEQLKRDALPLPVEYRDAMEKWGIVNKGSREVRLCIIDDVDVPVAVGLFDSMILIPHALLERLSEKEVDQITLHELAHLRRADDWTNGLQRVISALLPWNPAVQFIGQQLDLEREVACDDWVLSLVGTVRPYALCLTKMAESASWPRHTIPAPGVFATRKHISLRIERLLAAGRNIATSFSPVPAAAAIAIVGTLTLAMALVAPSVAAPAFYTLLPKTVAQVTPTTAPSANAAATAKPASASKNAASAVSPLPAAAASSALPAAAASPRSPNKIISVPGTHVHIPARTVTIPKVDVDTPGYTIAIPNVPPVPNTAYDKQKLEYDQQKLGAQISQSVKASIATANSATAAALSAAGLAGVAQHYAHGTGSRVAQAEPAKSCDDCQMAGVDWSGRDLHNVDYNGVDLSRAKLVGTNFSNGNFNGVDFSHSDLRSASFRGAHLVGCDFTRADLTGVDFTGAKISGCQFTDAQLGSTQLRDVLNSCTGCDFTRANLSGLDLSNVRANGDDFSHANLRNVNFSGARLTGVDFTRADLAGANLSGAILSGCDLSGVDLTHVDLSKVQLIGTDLSDRRSPP
jgi:uncharacterized protein YjbI with pentapeptide repeats/beta-lactamase regulating signal transducer with metallopeptidase domain